jgi:hypothetical protein
MARPQCDTPLVSVTVNYAPLEKTQAFFSHASWSSHMSDIFTFLQWIKLRIWPLSYVRLKCPHFVNH